MNSTERKLRQRMRDDLKHYCKKNLLIRAKKKNKKGKKVVPFKWNKAQQYLHERIEAHKKKYGRVRVLVLKGRQQGCSTYVGARYYQQTTHSKGMKTFILTHRKDATSNLFKMVNRYHDNCNPLLKPSTSNSNKQELIFDQLDSAYGLGTSGGGDVGRSDTIDLFHGSEVAFWTNTDSIKTGVMEAANEAEEIILESTAYGFDPLFHKMWMDAERGLSEYEAIFIPWYWQKEYEVEPIGDIDLSIEEAELLQNYAENGFTLQNLLWRRKKLISLTGDTKLFKQEYPMEASEAFQVTGIDSFIAPEYVLKCRKRKHASTAGAHIVGIDPARGGDRTAFMHRKGKTITFGKVFKTPDTKMIAGHIRELFESADPPDWCFLDMGGLGSTLYDFIELMPFGRYVIPVNFGSKDDVMKKDRYVNKRAEMAGEFKEWLMDDTNPASIPDDDVLQSDICAPGYGYDHEQRILLESKEKMKARNVPSTDLLDACKLTFAQPVAKRITTEAPIDDVPAMVL